MPRFVILEHDYPILHWDLMLETGPILRTWRLVEPPSPGKRIAAESSADHRAHYLDYEGPVSGGRGQVKRWLSGTYEIASESADMIEIRCRVADGALTMRIMRLADGEWVVQTSV